MNQHDTRHSTDLLFVLLIFAAFTLTAVMLIGLGSGEYRRIVQRMEDNNSARITTAYVTQKVREAREEGAISITDFHGLPALRIRTEHAGQPYDTFLYTFEGRLMELMTPPAYVDSVIPAGGTPLLPMETLSFRQLQNSAILMEGVTGSGQQVRALLTVSP